MNAKQEKEDERKRNVHQQTRSKQTARHQAEFEFKSQLSFQKHKTIEI